MNKVYDYSFISVKVVVPHEGNMHTRSYKVTTINDLGTKTNYRVYVLAIFEYICYLFITAIIIIH